MEFRKRKNKKVTTLRKTLSRRKYRHTGRPTWQSRCRPSLYRKALELIRVWTV